MGQGIRKDIEINIGLEEYIVPRSKAYLESVRNQLVECHKEIMCVKRQKPGKRPLLDIEYPKGYEG